MLRVPAIAGPIERRVLLRLARKEAEACVLLLDPITSPFDNVFGSLTSTARQSALFFFSAAAMISAYVNVDLPLARFNAG